jgi:Bifunctional DNA primase/polymerase, N-terminal
MTPLGTAALDLAAKGFRVFPCVERGKEPAIHDNLKRATTDANIITGWWRSRDFNIGIATGDGSGIWVLDVDGEEGEETLRQLEAAHGALPQTVEAITGKGRHVYFRWPSGTEIRNSQLRADVPGLDWRANGGFVLSPPSIHPGGRVYAWSVDSSSEFADAPPWLIEIVTDKRRGDRSTTNDGGEAAAAATTPEAWRSFINEPVDGSRRGKAIARFYGLLVRRYLDPILARDTVRMFNELRCKPPLDDAEVVHITEDISGRELKRRGQ